MSGYITLSSAAELDPVRRFVELVPDLVEEARDAATTAYSYRDFWVGSTGFGIVNGEEHHPSAGNIKRKAHGKICAEPQVANEAKREGLIQLSGLVVAATTDIDLIEGVNHYRTPTLHCCVDCQHKLHSHPVVSDDTLIVTTGLEEDIYQAFTFGWLRQKYFHQDRPAIEGARVMPNFEGWQRRVGLYDKLLFAESQSLPERRRTPASVAVMALTATLKPDQSRSRLSPYPKNRSRRDS